MENIDLVIQNKYKDFFLILAKTYNDFISFNENNTKILYGYQDFYSLINDALKEIVERKNELQLNEKEILSNIGINSLNKNFNAFENSNKKIVEIFKSLFNNKYNFFMNIDKTDSTYNLIKKSILDKNNRNLMLISDDNNSSNLVHFILKKINKNFEDIFNELIPISDRISFSF